MRVIERRFQEPIEQLVPRLYLDADQSQAVVARQLGVSRFTLIGWMQRIRHRSQPAPAADTRLEAAS